MADNGGPCCACMQVEYLPQQHPERGTLSERWLCRSCGREFVPRARIATLEAENADRDARWEGLRNRYSIIDLSRQKESDALLIRGLLREMDTISTPADVVRVVIVQDSEDRAWFSLEGEDAGDAAQEYEPGERFCLVRLPARESEGDGR